MAGDPSRDNPEPKDVGRVLEIVPGQRFSLQFQPSPEHARRPPVANHRDSTVSLFQLPEVATLGERFSPARSSSAMGCLRERGRPKHHDPLNPGSVVDSNR